MKELFGKRMANLLTVKSIVTITLTVTFCADAMSARDWAVSWARA